MSQTDVQRVLTMDVALAATREAFVSVSENHAKIPQRHHLPMKDPVGDMLVMSGFLPELNSLGLKVVSVYPGNPSSGLPATLGMMVLLDPTTGEPNLMMDATFLTSIRTGSASGVATDLLANPEADSVALLGSGGMAWHQLEAICHVRTIRRVFLWSRTHENAVKFAKENIAKLPNIEVMVTKTPDEAVTQADIIASATSTAKPIIRGELLRPGAHVNLIGSHAPEFRELDTHGFCRAYVVAVDSVKAAVICGDLATPIAEGKLQENDLVNIGDIITDPTKGRRTEHDITVFKSVGLAAQDLAVGMHVFRLADEHALGTKVDLLS